MRITMYVMNDVTRDSRVLREATSLAGAGHEVTIMATTRPEEASGSREVRNGFTVIRVAMVRRWPLWYVWLQHPWRLRRRLAVDLRAAFHRGPRGIGRALVELGLAMLSLPWVAVRGAWYLVMHQVRGGPAGRNWLDYVLWWRSFVLGWGRNALALAPAADIHHANDMETLPVAIEAARRDGGRVVYDSHEIFLEWGEHLRQPAWLRAVVARWERRMAQQAAAVITVNDACAAELERRLRLQQVVTVHNCPSRWSPPDPPTNRLRAAAGIPEGAPIVLCHGGFQAGRGLEQTAQAVTESGLEQVRLVFLGYRTAFLEPILAAFPDPGRIHVLPAVQPEDLLEWVVGADVDVIVFQPTELNNVLSTPNKLFESLAAGVPVVSSDFPARRRIVMNDPDGPLGAVCDPTDPRAIAAAIRSIVELDPADRADLRRRCLAAAHARWNWETESARLLEVYARFAVDESRV